MKETMMDMMEENPFRAMGEEIARLEAEGKMPEGFDLEAACNDEKFLELLHAFHTFSYLMCAAVLGYPVTNGHRHRHVGAPPSFILKVSRPFRSSIFCTVNFQQRDRLLSFQITIEPFHGQSCDGCHSLESILVGVCHQITHLSTIGHACQECIHFTQSVSLLHITGQVAKGLHIVLFPSFLKRITYIPTIFVFGIFQSLRDAESKTVFPGCIGHGVLSHNASSVTMKDENERCIVLQTVGQKHRKMPPCSVNFQ